ncbi:sensor histidine kinase [Roseofilum sp. Guam]|uniref:sensor histidine kinase n=1 Tax=Roseofilum sp. Guam TaxID=2821502 RepID=UPI001B117640|nr:ATP-binding protein [Roseofilum sp. Guam]MBP0027015.1 HAMP domain-containing histidine kinase [Roseofilum sp. Guam]
MIAREPPPNFWVKTLLCRTYSKLPLQQKISIPFAFVFLGLWLLGTVSIGYYFLKHLERRQLREVESVAALVVQQFQNKTETLRLNATVTVESANILEGLENAHEISLLQRLLPLKLLLDLDLVQVIDIQGQLLVDLKLNRISHSKINHEVAISQVMSGVSFSTIVDTENKVNPSASVLIATAPIKLHQGIVGGVIIGRIINSKFLSEISQGTNTSIVICKNNKVIASSLPEAEQFSWRPPPETPRNTFSESVIELGDRSYLGKTVSIIEMNQSQLQLVVLSSLHALEKAKQNFLIGLVLFSVVGSVIAILVGYLLSGLMVTRINSVTQATEKLANDNLWVKLPVLYNDELDRLAKAFNRMAKKLKDRDEALKIKVEQLEETLQKLYFTQSQLIQSEKMSGLGQMIAGIAHEFNNPVNFIYANIEPAIHYVDDLLYLLDLYKEEYPNPPASIADTLEDIDFDFLVQDFHDLLTSIKSGAERISSIVRGLRTFSRLDQSGIKLVDVHENLEATLLVVQHRLQDNIQAKTNSTKAIQIIKQYGTLPLVTCDPGELNQVFLNAINNAIDALEELRSDVENSKNPQIVLKTEWCDRSSVKITISDNGCGMSEEVKGKIFDPFFTTKPVGSGTGLGLSINYSIVVDHCRGKLRCHSIPGEGTDLIIELPLEKNVIQNFAL